MGSLKPVRSFVRAHAGELGEQRTFDLVMAVNEVATNSLRYGGGRGTLRVWRDNKAIICEVSDEGQIDEPHMGRIRPATEQVEGRGMWLVHQLCDLVQIRSFENGTVVRMHMWVPAA